MDNEIWVPMLNYEGLYEVSNLGRVKSLPKKWTLPNGGIRSHKGMIMHPSFNQNGYLVVSIRKNNIKKQRRVHRLVYESFYGATTKEIDHIVERNQSDASLANLQELTSRQNISKNKKSLNVTSKYTGVCWIPKINKWQSQIWIKPKKYWLGYHETEIEAYQAYQDALIKYDHLINPVRA